MNNIAMLIDADNAPAKFIQKILTELASVHPFIPSY